MSKGMKKGLTVAGIILAVILAIMIAIPVFFKDKIKDAVLVAANKELEATIDIKDVDLSLFSNFPKATIALKETTVIGRNEFEGDTLLYAKEASATIDIMSLFGDNFEISKIILDDARINAIVLENGNVNWDITKAGEEVAEAAEDADAFKLDLQSIVLNRTRIVYDDREGKMKAVLADGNGNLSGDFSAGETTLKVAATISEISVYMGNVPYIYKVKGVAEGKIKADLNNMKFTFIDSNVSLNELRASIDGSFGFVGEDGMDFDLKLNAPDTEFKDILSIVPAMYTDEFKSLKTSGKASLDAYIKGVMEGDTYPAFNLAMHVGNASFQYPSLPQAVTAINMDLLVTNPGGSFDKTVIDLSKMSFTMGGNPFSGALKVTTPDSDANIVAHANGTIDLDKIKDVYPLEKKGTELNGVIKANLDLSARMSMIEKEQYEQIQAKGHLHINNMKYTDQDMDVLINKAELEFTPRYVNLPAFNMTIGKNDISANGRLENFIAFALKDDVLKGNLNINSNYLNANDFISEETSGVEAEEATSEDIIIPKNLNFVFNANLKQVIYGTIDMTDVAGNMSINNGVLKLNNISTNLLGGSARITGAYDTSNPKEPKVDFIVNLNQVSFAETFKQVDAIKTMAPIFENMQGNYSMNFDFKTLMGATTEKTLQAMNGTGKINTANLKIENVKALDALAKALKADGLRTISPKDVNLDFTVKDGRIATQPFALNLGKGGVLNLEGSTGLDQSINYKGNVTLPEGMSSQYLKNVPITITGDFTSPKIGVDVKAAAGDVLSGVAEKLLGGKDGEEKTKEQEAVSNVVNKLTGGGDKLERAKKEREDAKASSEKLVEAAKKQAEGLMEKAGDNRLKKAGAKAAGDALVKEAEKAGKKLVDGAEERAKKLEAEAAESAEEK